MTPEQLSRQQIDHRLRQAGWEVQDFSQINISAGLGVAVREFPLQSGFADYMLYARGKAIGVIEAKPQGHTLTGVEIQSGKYLEGLPGNLPHYRLPLPFAYESNGIATQFTNTLKLSDLDEFVDCYKPGKRYLRKATWSEETPEGRWRSYDNEEILKRDKLSLDIFWLKDKSLEDSEDLPEPDVLAQQIADDLQTALEQFAAIAEKVKG